MTGSPISDLVPLLMSADSQLTLVTSSGEKRTVPIRGFYTAYRRNIARPDEILLSVTVPYTAEVGVKLMTLKIYGKMKKSFSKYLSGYV